VILKTFDSCPLGFRKLIWQTFFTSKNRGTTLETHSPWLFKGEGFFAICALTETGDISGGAILKALDCDGESSCGLLGYVCVQDKYRNLGIASQIVTEAISIAKQAGYTGITLWTQSPEVYSRHGFVYNASEFLGRYIGTRKHSPTRAPLDYEVISCDLSQTGMPAFASAIERYVTSTLKITIASTNRGPSVIEFNGSPSELFDFCNAVFSNGWWLNGYIDDPAVRWLSKNADQPVETVASCRYDLELTGNSPNKSLRIAILDRI
jgi:GNAT superfamily N-acetyltransferase